MLLSAVDEYDNFNRPTKLWTIKSQEVANFVEDVHTAADGSAMEYTTQKTFQEIAKELSNVTKPSNEASFQYGIYVDGMEYSEWMVANDHADVDEIASTVSLEGFNAVMDTKNTGHFTPSNNGVLTQVFVIDEIEYYDAQGNYHQEDGKVIVSCINTYLAEVRDSYDFENGEYSTTVRYYSNVMEKSDNEPEGLDVPTYIDFDVVTKEQFAKGDIVMVQASADGVTADGRGSWSDDSLEIINVYHPETEQGEVTSVKMSADSVGGLWVNINEIEYEYSVAMRGDLNELNDTMSPNAGNEIIAYFDGNTQENGQGYILGYELIEATPQYLYVEESDNDGFNFYTGSTARVTFADGTPGIIEISHIDGEQVGWDNYTEIPEGSRFKDDNKNWVSANENFVVDMESDGSYTVDTETVENRIFGWEKLEAADGTVTYNLTTTIQDPYTKDGGANKGGYLAMSNDSEAGNGIFEHGTLDFETTATGLTDDATPIRNTMAVFTSVYLPDDINSETLVFDDSDEYNGASGLSEDDSAPYQFVGGQAVANPNNGTGEPDEFYNFALEKGKISSYVLESPSKGTYYYYNDEHDDYTDGLRSGHIIDGSVYKTDTASKYDHLFLVDANTTFVDVVNDKVWVGNESDDFETITNGQLNMQVLFGDGGIATTVFINNGIADAIDEGDYFVIKDTKPVETRVDGMTIYTYTVWINGEEREIYSKSKEIVVTNNDKLDNEGDTVGLKEDCLYQITEQDQNDGSVLTVEYKYNYGPLADVHYNGDQFNAKHPNGTNYTTTSYKDPIYNSNWAVAKLSSASVLQLEYNDTFVDTNTNANGTMDKLGAAGEDWFKCDSETVYMVLQANNSGEIDKVYKGDYSDIITYRDNDDRQTSWVDVVTVKDNTDETHTPTARLVVVVKTAQNSTDGTDGESIIDATYEVKTGVNSDGTTVSTTNYGANKNDAIQMQVTYNSNELAPYSDELMDDIFDALKITDGFTSDAWYEVRAKSGNEVWFVVGDYWNGKELEPIWYTVNVTEYDSTNNPNGDMVQGADFISLDSNELADLSGGTNQIIKSDYANILDGSSSYDVEDIRLGTTVAELMKMGILKGDTLGDYVRLYYNTAGVEHDGTAVSSSSNIFVTGTDFSTWTMSDLLWDHSAHKVDYGNNDITNITTNMEKLTVNETFLTTNGGVGDFTVSVGYGGTPITTSSSTSQDVVGVAATATAEAYKEYYAVADSGKEFTVTVEFGNGALQTFDTANLASFSFTGTGGSATGGATLASPNDGVTMTDGKIVLTAVGATVSGNTAHREYAKNGLVTFSFVQGQEPEKAITLYNADGSKSDLNVTESTTPSELFAILKDATGVENDVLIVNDVVYNAPADDVAMIEEEKSIFDGLGLGQIPEIVAEGALRTITLPDGVDVATSSKDVAVEGKAWFDADQEADATNDTKTLYVLSGQGADVTVTEEASKARASFGMVLDTGKFLYAVNDLAVAKGGGTLTIESGTTDEAYILVASLTSLGGDVSNVKVGDETWVVNDGGTELSLVADGSVLTLTATSAATPVVLTLASNAPISETITGTGAITFVMGTASGTGTMTFSGGGASGGGA